MKRFITMIMAIALCTLGSQAQQFKVTRDTIHIDAGLFGETPKMNIHLRAADSREELYLLMRHSVSKNGHSKSNFLCIDKNSHTVRNIDLPDSLYAYGNLFMRHDSLILKMENFHTDDMWHYEQACEDHDQEEMEKIWNYTLDTCTDQWIPVKSVNDLIYEDNQYKVYYWHCGEWGSYHVFQETKNGKRHLFTSSGRLLKYNGNYYRVSLFSICKIDNPRKGKVYHRKKYYELKKKDYSTPQRILQLPYNKIGFEITKEFLLNDPRTYICTAFIHDDKFYCIMRSPEGLYIASYQDGVLHKEMDLGCNYNRRYWQGFQLQENNHPNNQAFFEFIDAKEDNPVILTVEGANIHIWYLEIK